MSQIGWRQIVSRGLLIIGVAVVLSPALSARDLTYEEALDIAQSGSSQAEIIRGNLEVAERQYQAERVNFYLPEITLNGTLPALRSAEEYTFPEGGGGQKEVGLRESLNLNTFIGLNQSLFTGGTLDLRAWLNRNSQEYPNRDGFIADELERTGRFSASLEQPLLQPSDAKHALNNRKDDLAIAELNRHEEISTLKQDVTNLYVGALALEIEKKITEEKLRSATLKAEIDSLKLEDGVVSEEDWLISSSERLDAELAVYDTQRDWSQEMQDLVILLDIDDYRDLQLFPPAVIPDPIGDERERLLAAADNSVPIRKAECAYRKAERAADYAASSAGIQGTLSANYQKDAGDVETEFSGHDSLNRTSRLNLDTWEVRVEFSYPLWDGGASAAEIRAQELEAKKAMIELDRQRKVVRAEIVNLIEGINVSYRKLEVLDKQINVSRDRLAIARKRFDNGEISEIEYLESSVAHLESRKKYLEELQNYLVDIYDLDAKFTG